MKKLKRWNRGLIAGAVLIIAVIIFQAADQARFKSNIPEISSIIQNYESESAAALTEISGQRADKAAFFTPLEQFWSEPETVSQAMRYNYSRSAFYGILDDEAVFLPLAYEEKLQSCRISKGGPGICNAVLTIDSTAWLGQYGSYLTPFGVGYAYNEMAEDFSQELETPDAVEKGEQAIRLSCQLEVTLQLIETGGTWKIAYSQMYTMSSSSSFVNIQEVPA